MKTIGDHIRFATELGKIVSEHQASPRSTIENIASYCDQPRALAYTISRYLTCTCQQQFIAAALAFGIVKKEETEGRG
jgi:hypothetical protein